MRKEKKQFVTLRKTVIRYNKALIFVFALYMLYALIHSVSILDCSGINFYSISGKVTKEMLKCTNMSTGLLAFMTNNRILISIIFLVVAAVILILQKITLFKINKLEVSDLKEEKVYKLGHIIITILFGYTGAHKYRTQNKVIGNIYLVNFIFFVISWIVKTFFKTTYTTYPIFLCAYEFSLIFIIGIIILNIIEAIFSLISLKDDDEKIFA